ncbi:FAD-dependent oxidoreductase [Pedobacter sp. PWIIR3]
MENTNHFVPRDGNTESLWNAGLAKPQQVIPEHLNRVFDTIIIGAGITGITTALNLQKAGQQCLVIEAGTLGFGTTGGTSAHLNTFFDATYPEIEKDFGADAAKLVAASGKEAMSTIKGNVDEYQIDCDFEYKGAYLFSETDKETRHLKEILAASRKAGIAVTEYQDNGVPVPFQLAIHFIEQGQFHPLKYINALAEEFARLGGALLENTFVTDDQYENELHTVSAGQSTFTGINLIYATHMPPGITPFSFRCAPYRSYVLAAKLSHDAYPIGLAYDMQEPYHYFRTHEIKGEKYLLIGGEDHKTGHGDPVEAMKNLEAYVRKYYRVASIDYQWSSQYYVPVDGLPYIGELPGAKNTYCATGFNGNGMMFGTLSGKIISDLILGIENPYADLYSPSRLKPVAGFTEFVKENADVAWHFVADRFNAEDLDSFADLAPGQGTVAEINGKKVAAYKDENGKVTALNPTCTHAGCTVVFNDVEKSWDCPFHGGRFDIEGNVITGPPRTALKKAVLPTYK